jgi:alkanesulfonate monooxygenase SsuD/methylene tetrahydromethanopterin reductase-like flavin-dependent oxidoreductase (luciferase family)
MDNFRIDQNNGMEIGLYSLGDYMPDVAGKYITESQRIKEIVAASKLANDAGLDVFALGESHQQYFVSQAHQVILGAIANATSNIKITSGVTVLSTSDPVRVYEEFSTLDLLSEQQPMN